MAGIIKTTDLRKVYKIGSEKVVALDCINLEIEKGQVCCILGTSGSGKSTLLNQLAGLEKPTRGDVFIKGKNISKMSEKQLAHFRQRNVGFVFQSYNLLQGMSGIDNVAIPLTFRGMGKRKRVTLAKEMLTAVGLGKRMYHKPNEMSGGQQQRVGIARAFVAKPDVVFADEPTGNLDTRTTREVMNLFLDFARRLQITIVLVTHDRELARYADRIVTVVDGNVISDVRNYSLYDVTRELREKLEALLGEADSKHMAQLLLEHRRDYGEGVAVQAMETLPREGLTEAVLTQLQAAAADDEQRGAISKILQDAQLLEAPEHQAVLSGLMPESGAELQKEQPTPEPEAVELVDATGEPEPSEETKTESSNNGVTPGGE